MGIGTTSPHDSALPHLASMARGFLPPCMTEAERDAIVPSDEGPMIYNLTVHEP